jgi:hypothetical protein
MPLSRRDGAIVAWHEVPGQRHPKSRPVGHGLIRAGVRANSIGSDEISNTKYIASLKKHGRHLRRQIPLGLAAPDHTVPYGTVLSLDALPGTSCQATIMLSLWDERFSPRRGFDYLSAYEGKPWAGLGFPGPSGRRSKCPNYRARRAMGPKGQCAMPPSKVA